MAYDDVIGGAQADRSGVLRRRLRPGDARWPDESSWNRLRQVVNGNLLRPRPLFDQETPAASQAGRSAAYAGVRNPYWIGDQPAGTQTSGWYGAWTPEPSAYVVRASGVADVVAAVNFARDCDLRMVVKGGAHSYLGQSSAPDSLMIWTRGMNRVVVQESFVAQGCDGVAEPCPAVTADAGALWADLYDEVTVRGGRYVQGGGCMTVGVPGLLLGGGFGIFSKNFGTAASWLLEAEIVTADGQVRIANASSNPDLFWAIKGGGGGTFGVITRVTLQTHDLPQFFGNAIGLVQARSDEAFVRLISAFLEAVSEGVEWPGPV